MKFITNICMIAGLILPTVALCSDVTVYVVADCADTAKLTSAEKAFCDEPSYYNCTSSSGAVSKPSPYDTCGAFKFAYAAHRYVATLVVCFDGSEVTCPMLTSCGSSYYEEEPVLPRISAITTKTTAILYNYAYRKCCQTCTGTGWADVSDQNYQRQQDKICSNSYPSSSLTSTCLVQTQGMNHFRCKAGFYNAKGSESVSGMPNTLDCQPCPVQTTQQAETSPAGASAITQCYLPKNTTLNDIDGDGTYSFVNSNCEYTE